MPKNFKSLLYSVQIILVLAVNSLLKAFYADAETNNSGSIALALVLIAFILVMIFKSLPYVNTKKKNIVLWVGSLFIILGVILIFFMTENTAAERYSLVFGIIYAFAINYAGNFWLQDEMD
ncbi:MAG: hypothetical protein GX778_02465 [Erysipelothrix sp.]|nr:hypothetical protein [Erysipelothrix sp.]